MRQTCWETGQGDRPEIGLLDGHWKAIEGRREKEGRSRREGKEKKSV